MREIKFRLIKEGKIVGYEKHILSCGKIQIFHSTNGDDEPRWEWWNIQIVKRRWIEHDDKEQFTGLRDKNSREIYEGDICQFSSLSKRTIVFKDGAFGYEEIKDFIAFGGHYHFYSIMAEIEVLGNIHENPELLKEGE